MSYYPEGVTGNEWQIAGPSAEFTESREVECGNDDCEDFESLVEVEGETRAYGEERVFDWTCPKCNHEWEQEYVYEAY